MRVVFGGTFDPVHVGHIKMALELKDCLSLDTLYLMPCFKAAHKNAVSASAEHRCNMLNLAVKQFKSLQIDDREILRGETSYTIESMKELRRLIGNESLCFVLGSDALQSFVSWKNVEMFSSLAHLIIINRPVDQDVMSINDPLSQSELLSVSNLENLGYLPAVSYVDLAQSTNGYYLSVELSKIKVSSSMIRERVTKKESIETLVADEVNQYICDNGLYLT